MTAKGPSGQRVPGVDLSDEEVLGLMPSGQRPKAPSRPPPPANPPPDPRALMGPQPNLELDIAGDTFVTARWRPPVEGVSGGTRPTQAPTDEERAQAARIAGYGEVPTQFWRWGVYAWRVWKRRRGLRKELKPLQQLAAVSHQQYEKSVLKIVEKARQILVRDGKKPPMDKEERIQLAFRVLEDVRGWGAEMDPLRREVEGLQGIYEKRLRAAEIHELAIASVDERAYRVGMLSYVGGIALTLLLVFSPVIYRAIFPPDLPPLPPDATGP